MKKALIYLSLFTILLSLTSFAQDSSDDDGTITITGTIEHFYSGGGGGFYGIKADDGTEYRPERLTAGFQREGLRVKATAVLTDEGKKLLTRGWEVPIEIIQIERE